MSSVSLTDNLVTIGAGARLGHVYDALQRHGVTIPAGCGPSVGIAGLTLGGGLGVLGRTYGLTCDSLIAAQMVLADGQIVTCDEQHHEELFWAIRGAGARNFGVVTSLVFTAIPAPSTTVFHHRWPVRRAAMVISAWQDWAPVAPDGLAASLLLSASGNPDEPPVLKLFGTMIGTDQQTQALLDALVARTGVEPLSAHVMSTSHREAKRYLASLGSMEHAGEAPERPGREPGHLFIKSEFFRQTLPRGAVAALVEHFAEQRVAGQSRELDFTPWGGAYNRIPEGATAFVHRNERFLLKHATLVDADVSAADHDVARQWLSRSWALARPWGSGGVYPNFPDPQLEHWMQAYYGNNRDRLLRAKRRYDPDDFFRFEQSIR